MSDTTQHTTHDVVMEELSKQNPNLQTLLTLDNIVSELRNNKEFRLYFKEPQMQQLITNITEMPNPTQVTTQNYNDQCKYAFVSSELLKEDCAHVTKLMFSPNPQKETDKLEDDEEVTIEGIEPCNSSPSQDIEKEKLVKNLEANSPIINTSSKGDFPLFKRLMQFLEKDQINATLSGYWTSVLISYHGKCLNKCVEFYCNNMDSIKSTLAKHIYDSSMTEYVIKFLTLDITNLIENEFHTSFNALRDEVFIKIIKSFSSESQSIVENAHNIVTTILQSNDTKSPMIAYISSQSVTQILYGITNDAILSEFKTHQSIIAAHECICLLKQIIDCINKSLAEFGDSTDSNKSLSLESIITNVQAIRDILSIGKIKPTDFSNAKLKFLRLSVIEFVNSLLATRNQGVYKILYDERVFIHFLQYFKSYSTCSVLLCSIMDGINFLYKNGQFYPELLKSIFINEEMLNIMASNTPKNTILTYQYHLYTICKEFNFYNAEIYSKLPPQATQFYDTYSTIIKADMGKGIQSQQKKDMGNPQVSPEENEDIEVEEIKISSPFGDDIDEETIKFTVNEFNPSVEYYYVPSETNLCYDASTLISEVVDSQVYLN